MKQKTLQRYQDRKTQRAVRMLEKLIEKLENGEFVLEGHGWWPSNVENRVTFRVIVISNDSNQVSRTFDKFS